MTSTTLITALEVIASSASSSGHTDEFAIPQLLTQNASTTPLPSRVNDNGNTELITDPQAIVQHGNSNSNSNNNNNEFQFYGVGITEAISMLGSCIPWWTISQKRRSSQTSTPKNDCEIPFEIIKILDCVGTGAEASVFRGELSGEIVAVKKVKNLESLEIVKGLMKLKHENIISFIGLCVQAPCYCIVMEFCATGPLSEVLLSDKPISQQDWIRWLLEIAEGMNYLHQNKVIHRDLKSPNILLTKLNQIKICDFGTSQVRQDMKSAVMSFCGTLNWMAPEVILHRRCNEKVDVYSFGVVLWEMMTRQKPYKNIEQCSIMYGVGKRQLSLPITTNAPDGIKKLLRDCMSFEPRNRPSFASILKHKTIIQYELNSIGEENWPNVYRGWNEEAENFVYPESFNREPEFDYAAAARDLYHRRQQELKDAKDIRCMYEIKTKRVDKMIYDIAQCKQNLDEREEDIKRRERALLKFDRRYCVVSRTGPNTVRHEDVNSRSSGNHNNVDYFTDSSDDNRSINGGTIGGYRQSSGSRQSSQHSQTGRARNSHSPASPIINRSSRAHSEHQSSFSREDSFRNSNNLIRGSSNRNSGCSVDSGVNSQFGSSSYLNSNPSFSLSRNVDGRSSDSKLCTKKRSKKHSRESPVHDSKEKLGASSTNEKMKKMRQRIETIQKQRVAREAIVHQELKIENLPTTSTSRELPRIIDNPCYQNATVYTLSPKCSSLYHLKSNIDLESSLELNANDQRSLQTDASSENSDVDEANGNSLNSSLEVRLPYKLPGMSAQSKLSNVLSPAPPAQPSTSLSQENNKSLDNRTTSHMNSSISTMASSVERSLEIAAMHSDGLSDIEKIVKATTKKIRGHRRCSSHPINNYFLENDEISSDSDDAVDV